MNIPFLDLKAQYKTIRTEINIAIEKVLYSAAYASGPFVEEFEKDFAAFIGTRNAVGVNSGTSALHLALLALNIGEGDEVILPANTFISTAWAISYVGAKPVFVDVDPRTYNIDINLLEDKITSKTKAIIPVHLYGQPADLSHIMHLCEKHSIAMVEDAAQAAGAEYKKEKCGSFGIFGCFSFYPGKNLGAYGEAGAITTNDDELAERMRNLRNHAQTQKGLHSEIGYNYRMDGIQGAVLAVKLKHLADWNAKRRNAAKQYAYNLKGLIEVVTPYESDFSKHIYHLYSVQIANKRSRDGLMKFLAENGIATGLHYPVPIHLQEAYSDLGHTKGDFPLAEKAADCNLSLPMYPELSPDMITYVTDTIKKYFNK